MGTEQVVIRIKKHRTDLIGICWALHTVICTAEISPLVSSFPAHPVPMRQS